MKMEGVDRCRGRITEETCESLQLNLITKQLIFIKGRGICIPGEVTEKYFSLSVLSDLDIM